MNRRKTTFAFIALACIAGSASAQFIGKTSTVANLPACNSPLQAVLVTDSTNAVTLVGGGSTKVLASCASGSWAVVPLVALQIISAATLPTCDTAIAPAGFTALYWDTTGPDLCACPGGADWIAVDGTGTCA